MDTEFDALGSPAGFVSKYCSDNAGDLLIDVASISSLGESTKTSMKQPKPLLVKQPKLLLVLKAVLVKLFHIKDLLLLRAKMTIPHYLAHFLFQSIDVELALHTGKMTKDSMLAFLSSMASAMLFFQRYPTKEDYVMLRGALLKNMISCPLLLELPM